MTLRKAIGALPLAVSVAVLAHFVAFGFVHAPGAERSAELFVALAAALGFGLLGAFVSGASDAKRSSHASRERGAWFAPLLLAAAGTLTFGGIELSEGHLLFSSLVTAGAASLPLAYLVAFVSRCATRSMRSVGSRCAWLLCPAPRLCCAGASLVSRTLRREAAIVIALAAGSRRGRAPPLFI